MKTTISARDNIDFHATQHPLEFSENFETLERCCLHILHQKDYEEAAALVPSGLILDLGCNNGWGSYELSRYGHNVIGVDVSADALEDARKRFHAANLEFRHVSGLELPFGSNHFDLVTSFQVIEHIVDMDAYLNEIRRVLKPGGIVAFTTPNAMIRLDPDMKPWNRFHIQEFTPSRLEALLRPEFAEVKLRGQFAHDEIYRIEYERCQHGLRNARARSTSPFTMVRDRIKAILPNPVIEFVRNRRHRHSPARAIRHQPTAADREHLTTKNVFYRESDLERALGLMAVCTKGR
jgi:SAM-dependent methyltransferase